MADSLWADVYFHDRYAGVLKEEPSGATVFTYSDTYLSDNPKPIARHLPLSPQPHVWTRGLHPFFDNLVAEGWLANAQARALGTSPENRFALLAGFGLDCIGAISIRDPDPQSINQEALDDPQAIEAMASRASLSGVQPKLAVIQDGKNFRPTLLGETSTHIAKLRSPQHSDLLENEYLTLRASQQLLGKDPVCESQLGTLSDTGKDALIITRFDRIKNESGQITKIHFEEFAQLLNILSRQKYDGSYESMGSFIRETQSCMPVEVDTLFRRLLVMLITGNTDLHLKNMAMFHTPQGYRLTPSYDLVCSSYYPSYQSLALSLGGGKDLTIGNIKSKHVLQLTQSFQINEGTLSRAIADIHKQLSKAIEITIENSVGGKLLRVGLAERMEKRWNAITNSLPPAIKP